MFLSYLQAYIIFLSYKIKINTILLILILITLGISFQISSRYFYSLLEASSYEASSSQSLITKTIFLTVSYLNNFKFICIMTLIIDN